MALEYMLILKQKVDIGSVLTDMPLLKRENIKFYKSGNCVNLDLNAFAGFLIQIYEKHMSFVEYIDLKNENIGEDLLDSTFISFSFAKSYDNVLAKKNMLNILLEILRQTSADALLIFNGDYLVLERLGNIINVNKQMDFWTTLSFDFSLEFHGLSWKDKR